MPDDLPGRGVSVEGGGIQWALGSSSWAQASPSLALWPGSGRFQAVVSENVPHFGLGQCSSWPDSSYVSPAAAPSQAVHQWLTTSVHHVTCGVQLRARGTCPPDPHCRVRLSPFAVSSALWGGAGSVCGCPVPRLTLSERTQGFLS